MNNVKVITSDILQEKVDALKLVCNPTYFSGIFAYYQINLDVPATQNKLLRLLLNGKTYGDDPIVFTLVSYINGIDDITGNLSGLEEIELGVGTYLDADNVSKRCIVIGATQFSDINAGVFYGDGDQSDVYTDAKNRIVSIIGTNNVDGISFVSIPNAESLRDFSFTYTNKAGWGVRVENGDNIPEIEEAMYADEARSLSRDIPVRIQSDQSSSLVVTGSGSISADFDQSTLTVNIGQLPPAVITIPPASVNTLGGIKLCTGDELGASQYPILLTNDNRAFVEVPSADIHRYRDLSTVPNPVLGLIVLYIGNTTSQYTNGYFYQYWPTSFTVDPIPNDSTWCALAGIADTIKAYNATVNYSLVPGLRISVSLIDESDSDASEGEALFAVSLGSYTVDMTYEEIQQNLGIQLKNGYTVWDASDLNIYWRVATGSEAVWVLKNVQPIMQMLSALVYKGIVQTMTDLQALTPTAQTGDFYTVYQLSNQEYFFNGTDWEFMGDVFTVNGKLTIKSKDGSTETTVAEFTANQSDTTTVELVAGTNVLLAANTTGTDKKITISSTDTNTTYSFSLSNNTLTVTPSSGGSFSYTPTVPAAQVNADWNATSGVAEILHKPTIPAAANNATLTILKNGTSVGTFTADASSNATVNITVPTKTSELINDSGFITNADVIPVGTITMYAGGTSAPTGWLLCNGDRIIIRKDDTNPYYYYVIAAEQTILGIHFEDAELLALVNVIGDLYTYHTNRYAYWFEYTWPGHGVIRSWVKTINNGAIQNLASGPNDAGLFNDTLGEHPAWTWDGVNVSNYLTRYYLLDLPDLQQRFPLGAISNDTIGIDNSKDSILSLTRSGWDTAIGKTGGEETHKLKTYTSYDERGDCHQYALSQSGSGNFIYSVPNDGTSKVVPQSASEHNNIPPFLALNFIIKY